MKLPIPLAFDWDKGNLDKNWGKHRVHFREAEEIFFNKPLRILKDVKHSQKEDRFVALGTTDEERKLYIVFTIRDEKVRIISARNQSKRERKLYGKKENR